MPYKHSGEIGDIWKHLPLCDVLESEMPKRYIESNAAYAEYILPVTKQNTYGIFDVLIQNNNTAAKFKDSIYYKILENIDLVNKHRYYGSPALAMTILGNKTYFNFHDIEKEPLDDIVRFSYKQNIPNKVNVICGDSIEIFLRNNYSFNQNDFVFIDPYQPFDGDESGRNYFDVFIKAYNSNAKVMLWYGYDGLNKKNDIIEKLQEISHKNNNSSIYTFDIWQKCMKEDTCEINPGVPGCGIAAANLNKASIQKITDDIKIMGDLYKNATYEGAAASLCTGILKF